MRNKQVDRMNKINELIKVISEIDRRFFYSKSKDNVAKFIELKTTVNFIDDYTQKQITINDKSKNYNFSHGGTLWGLVKDFKHWILTGKNSNGKNGYGGLHCTHWGYTEEGMEKIRVKAREIGYIS